MVMYGEYHSLLHWEWRAIAEQFQLQLSFDNNMKNSQGIRDMNEQSGKQEVGVSSRKFLGDVSSLKFFNP